MTRNGFNTLHCDQQLPQSCLTQLFTAWEREQTLTPSKLWTEVHNLFEREVLSVRGKQGNIEYTKSEKVVQSRSCYLGILDISLLYSSPPSINNGISLKVWSLKAKLNICECFLPFFHSSVQCDFLISLGHGWRWSLFFTWWIWMTWKSSEIILTQQIPIILPWTCQVTGVFGPVLWFPLRVTVKERTCFLNSSSGKLPLQTWCQSYYEMYFKMGFLGSY